MISKIKEIEIAKIRIPKYSGSLDDLMFNEKLCNSIEQYGQLKAIIVRELKNGKYELIDGRKVIEAIKRLGHETIVCNNLGAITGEQARLVYLQSKIGFEPDNIEIAKLLISIKDKIGAREVSKVTKLRVRDIKSYYELFDFAIDKYKEKEKKRPKSFF